jgi:hypothetical protein
MFLQPSLFIYEAAFAGSCLHQRQCVTMAVKSKGESDCRSAMSTLKLGSIDPAHRMLVPSSLARGLMRQDGKAQVPYTGGIRIAPSTTPCRS